MSQKFIPLVVVTLALVVACQSPPPTMRQGGSKVAASPGAEVYIVEPTLYQEFMIPHVSLWNAKHTRNGAVAATVTNPSPDLQGKAGYYTYRIVIKNSGPKSISVHPKGSKLLPEVSVPDNKTGKLVAVPTEAAHAYSCCNVVASLLEQMFRRNADGTVTIQPGGSFVVDVAYLYRSDRLPRQLVVYRPGPPKPEPWVSIPLPRARLAGLTWEQWSQQTPYPENPKREVLPFADDLKEVEPSPSPAPKQDQP